MSLPEVKKVRAAEYLYHCFVRFDSQSDEGVDDVPDGKVCKLEVVFPFFNGSRAGQDSVVDSGNLEPFVIKRDRNTRTEYGGYDTRFPENKQLPGVQVINILLDVWSVHFIYNFR